MIISELDIRYYISEETTNLIYPDFVRYFIDCYKHSLNFLTFSSLNYFPQSFSSSHGSFDAVHLNNCVL